MIRVIQMLLAVMLLTTTMMADVSKGKRYYMKHLKQKFKMDGLTFVQLHTQAEWEALFKDDADGFVKEFSKRFPRRQAYLQKPSVRAKLQDVGDFAIMYAKDSGKVPSCGDVEEVEIPLVPEPQESSVPKLF